MSIEVLNETDAAIDEHELVEISRFVMRELNVHPRTELCIRLVDEAAMETLHVQWMDLPGPTDVMSFPDGRATSARTARTRGGHAR